MNPFAGKSLPVMMAAALLCTAPIMVAKAAEKNDENTILVHTEAGNVTLRDARDNLAALPEQTRETATQDATTLDNMVRVIAAQKVLLKEAQSQGWDRKPEVISAIAQARNNTILQSYLKHRSEPPKDYPSELDIQNAYDLNRAAFVIPKKYHVAQIFISSPTADPVDKQDAADKILAGVLDALKKPEADFLQVAKSAGNTQTAKLQGDIGELAVAQMDPKMAEAVIKLEKGGVSEPVRLKDGWHIIKLIETIPAGTTPLKDVRDPLVKQLREQRTVMNERSYIDELVKKMPAADPKAMAGLLDRPDSKTP